jgi:CBS domain containing-hemolysin-like protein
MEPFNTLDFIRILAVIFLVLLNGFFVAAEFALVSVRKTRIAELLAKGDTAARWVQRALEDPDRFIAATQLGITIASLGLGWIGEPALGKLIQPLVELFPLEMQPGLSHTISAAIAFAAITFLHVVVGELAAKSIALQYPERTSLFVAKPTVWAEWVFKPAISVLNGAANRLLRWIGMQPPTGHEMVHSVEELKMLISASAQEGVVENDAQEMVHAVFDLSKALVRQIMTPRTEVIAIPREANLQQIQSTANQNGFSKMPVYEGDLDQVVGVIHVKDVMLAQDRQGAEDLTAGDIARDAVFIPEVARLGTLLQLFRARQRHIAIVLDEYGGTAGLVTLDDVLEEIVGEVGDPFDREPDLQPQADGSVLLDGLMPIEEVNETFGLQLIDPYYDTIAGYMLGHLGRLAKVGDTVEVDGVRLRVEALDGKRVARVWLYPQPSKGSQPESPTYGK